MDQKPSIADLAVFMFEQANRQARLNEMAEELVARMNNRTMDIHFREMLRTAEFYAAAHALLKGLSEHENEIALLIAKPAAAARVGAAA